MMGEVRQEKKDRVDISNELKTNHELKEFYL